MQWIEGSPYVLVDGCHNTQAVAAMVTSARPLCGDRHVVAVFGAMADKDLDDMLAALRPLTSEVVFAPPHTPRAAPAADLAARWGPGATAAASVAAGLAAARSARGTRRRRGGVRVALRRR